MRKREAEVLDMQKGNNSMSAARQVAQGRAVVERYRQRLRDAVERIDTPEAAELYCVLAQLHEGLIDHDIEIARACYEHALAVFPQCRAATVGMRRIAREGHDYQSLLDALSRERGETADESKKKALSLSCARICLYCLGNAQQAIAILEELDAQEEANESEEIAFDPEKFLLWEDALLATGAWDKYESKLRDALHQQNHISILTQHLEERLWMIYRFICPDEEQTHLLCDHLMRLQPLDDELVDDELSRLLAHEQYNDIVALLSKAVERLEGSPREPYYHALLADIAAYHFEDFVRAIDILSDDACKDTVNVVLFAQLLEYLTFSGRTEESLNVYARILECIQTPRQKADLLYRLASIMCDELSVEDSALSIFSGANETCPVHEPTIDAMVAIYSKRGDWERVSQIYEYELSYAAEHQLPEYTTEVYIQRHARLAALYERFQLHPFNAFNHYQAILRLRPDDIAALKGASRMAQTLGNWPELLQLYAAAEGCTQDTHEHSYLLERIAQIADSCLNDADTACTALEALRSIDPAYTSTRSNLARLYVKLEKWEALIALTDEEIESVSNSEYKATLLVRNGEVSETKLSNIPQAILYYEKARAVSSASLQAAFALERLYTSQKSWEKLVELYKSEAALTPDATIKCACLRHMAQTLKRELDAEEEAVAVYETILKINPKDTVALQFLTDYYYRLQQWDDVLRIRNIELSGGGAFGMKHLTLYHIARIYLYQLDDPYHALDAIEQACGEQPDDIVLLNMWIMMAKRTGKMADVREKLAQLLPNIADPNTHADAELFVAYCDLSITHDPKSLDCFVDKTDILTRFKGIGSRFLSTVLVANDSAAGRWTSRIALALMPKQTQELRLHALHAAIELNLPEEIQERALEVLCQISDFNIAKHLWFALSPAQRPSYDKLPDACFDDDSADARQLKRWRAVSALLDGNIDDSVENLLPENKDDNVSYRPELELLAAYFEQLEAWESLLQVLGALEENMRNEHEIIQIILQRARVLSKIRKPQEALECIRQACEQASFDNDVRLSLYDYLEKQKDWDFLSEQLRKHLLHTTDRFNTCALWLRLANIYRNGMNNLLEALRCLDSAYQADPERGDILLEISQTAEDVEQLDIARRALDDYIQYHYPTIEEQIALAPRLFSLHFMRPGGDRPRLLVYFDDLLRKSVDSRECRIILAKANAIAGDPARAAQLILSLVDNTISSDDIDLWMTLADIYLEKLNDPKRGEEILWKIFQTYPTAEHIIDRLDQLYTTPVERRIFVENIQNSVATCPAIQSDPERVRKFLAFAASIWGRELGDWKKSQELYSQAIDASCLPDSELFKNRAYARCRISGEAKSAYMEFCGLLVGDPFQADLYKPLVDLCKRNRATDRERIFKQLAQVFIPGENIGSNVTEIRPKMMDSRPLSDDILLKHLPPQPLRTVQSVLHEAMPILSRVLRDNVPRRTILGGEKIRDAQITSLFSVCGTAFGINNIKGFVGLDAGQEPTVLDDDCYWIMPETWQQLSADLRRHWAGFAAGKLWTGISDLTFSDPLSIWRFLDGIYFLATGNGLAQRDAYTKEAADSVDNFFDRALRKNIAAMIDNIGREHFAQADAPAWLECINATADRAGLLFSGSLCASLPAILIAEGWNPNNTDRDYLSARYKQSLRLQNLVRFALSDDYLQLRYHAGLSLQPSEIKG